MKNKDTFIKFKNVIYRVHPAFDPKHAQDESTEPNCNYITVEDKIYSDVLDLSFIDAKDQFFGDLNDEKFSNVRDIYLNSSDMPNIHFYSNRQQNTLLHVTDSHYNLEETYNSYKFAPANKALISDSNDFFAKTKTNDQKQIFKRVSFENMSFKLSNDIRAVCEQNDIQSYGMLTNEDIKKAYFKAVANKGRATPVKLSKLNIANTEADLTMGK